MATRTISTKLAVEGESEYKKAISNINAELKTMNTNLELVESQFKNNQNSMEALSAKSEALADKQAKLTEKVKTCHDAYENAEKALKTYTEKTDSLSESVKKNSDEINGLSDETKKSGEQWNAYQKEVDDAESQLAALQNTTGDTSQEEAELTEKITDTKASMAQLNEETGGAAEQAGNLLTEQDKLNGELEDSQAKQDAASKACEQWKQAENKAQIQLNNTNAEIELNEKYLDEAKNSADGCATSINEFGEKAEDAGKRGADAMQMLGDVIAAAGITKALKEIVKAIEDCIDAFGDFEAEMSKVEAISGATADDMDALTAAAKQMGSTTSFTAEEAGQALEYMALAGWDTESMLQGLEPILNLAAASAMDLGEASDIVTDYLTAFGLSAADAADFTDMMAYAMANSNTTTEDLGEAYKNCAATMGSMGVSAEDTTAVLMTMANAGIKGGEAGTALNTIMTRLATNTKGCCDVLEDYGVVVYDANGQMNDLSEILGGLAKVWDTLTDAEQASISKTIAGTNQYSALQTIMNGCSSSAAAAGQSFEDYAEALEYCSGTAAAQADTMLDNLNGKMTLLSSAADGLKIAIGESLSDAFGGLIDVLTDVISGLTDFVDEHPAVVEAFTAIVAIVGAATVGVVAYNAAMKIASGFTGGSFMLVAAGIAAVSGALIGIVTAFQNAHDWAGKLEESLEDVAAAQETVAKDEEILALADRYHELSDQVEDASLGEEELAQKEAELEEVRQRLDELTDGRVSSEEDLKDAYDGTLDAVVGLTEAEKDRSEADWYASLQEGAKAYEKQMEELEAKQSELNEATEASTRKIDDMYAGSDAVYEQLYSQLDALREINVDYDTMEGVDELQDGLAEIAQTLSDVNGTDVELHSIPEAEAAINALSVTTLDLSKNVLATSDDLDEMQGEVDELAESTDAYREEVIAAIDQGIMPMKDGAELLNISTEEMQELWLESATAAYELEHATEDAADAEEDLAESAKDVTKYSEKTDLELLQLKYAAEMVSEGMMDADHAALAYGIDVDELTDYIDIQTDVMADLDAAAQAISNGYMNAETAAEDFGVSVDDLSDYIVDHNDDLGLLDQAVEAVESGYMSAEEAATQFGTNVDAISLEQAKSEAATLGEGLVDLQTAYAESYEAAYESLSNQMSLWDQADEIVAMSTDDIMKALDSQLQYWTEYDDNVEDLYSRNIEGLSDLVNSIDDGSTQAANYIAGLSQMSDEELQAMVDKYGEVDAKVQETADAHVTMGDDITAAMEDMVTATVESISEMDLSDEAWAAAYNTLEGYIKGVDDETGDVEDIFGDTADDIMNTFTNALGIASPSKEFKSYGEDTVEGYVKGVSSSESSATKEMQTLANSALNAFKEICTITCLTSTGTSVIQGFDSGISGMQSAANSQMQSVANSAISSFTNIATSSALYNSGANTIQGYINGLNSKTSSLYSTMQSIANTALSKFNSTLGVASPATEFIKSAEYSAEGFMLGIRSMEPEINDTMVEMANQAMDAFDVKLCGIDAAETSLMSSLAGVSGSGGPDMLAILDQNGQDISEMVTILQMYLPYLPSLANMKVVLDSGATVGGLATQMDRRLGQFATYRARGN